MPVTIEIKDTDVDALIEFYTQQLKAVRTEMSALVNREKDISATIFQLRQTQVKSNGDFNPVTASEVYSTKWTWLRKIKFAIAYKGKGLSSREIVEVLADFDEEVRTDRKKAIASVSSTLSTKTDTDFVRFVGDGGEHVYLPKDSEDDWFPRVNDLVNEFPSEPMKIGIINQKYYGGGEGITRYGTKIEKDDLPF